MSSSPVVATAIPSSRSKSFSTPAHSPQLITPTSTPPALIGSHYHHHHHGPPSFAEQRLQQLLMNCEAGTHSFQRGDGDDYGHSARQQSHGNGNGNVPGPSTGSGSGTTSGELRRKSFAAGEALPGQSSNRRPSFLSSLSLTRPFGGFTPSQPSSPATNPQRPPGLTMTSSSSPVSISNSPVQESEIHRAMSTPPQPQLQPLETKHLPADVNVGIATATGAATGMQMQRSKTAPSTPVKVAGFRTGGFGMTASQIPLEEKRHFDPSREPKLLGLL